MKTRTFISRRHLDKLRFDLTDDLRELAADLCAMMASTPGEWFGAACVEVLGLDGGVEHPAAYLAREALWANRNQREPGDKENWAEAEAMLRTGWVP